MLVREVPWNGAKAFAVDGTPSDCARLGSHLSDGKIDICISGINKGENVGAGIYYSGTVSAARDAAMLYMPAIAASLQFGGSEQGLQRLAQFTIDMAEKCVHYPFPRCGVLNINAPSTPVSEWKEPVFCPISSAYFLDNYVRRTSPLGQVYFWLGTEGDAPQVIHMEEHASATDADMLAKGHITLSVLSEFSTKNEDFTSLLSH